MFERENKQELRGVGDFSASVEVFNNLEDVKKLMEEVHGLLFEEPVSFFREQAYIEVWEYWQRLQMQLPVSKDDENQHPRFISLSSDEDSNDYFPKKYNYHQEVKNLREYAQILRQLKLSHSSSHDSLTATPSNSSAVQPNRQKDSTDTWLLISGGGFVASSAMTVASAIAAASPAVKLGTACLFMLTMAHPAVFFTMLALAVLALLSMIILAVKDSSLAAKTPQGSHTFTR